MTIENKTLWSPAVNKLEPYTPGEQPRDQQFIKLNTNESAFPPSPQIAKTISSANIELLRLYPDPQSQALKQTVSNYFNVTTKQVFVGNGSDEVLAHAFYAFFQQPKPLLFPSISYSFYPVYCNLYDIRYESMPLESDFSLDLTRFDEDNGGIIFPNPNAPTGMGIPLKQIRELLERNRQSVVIVDEAYIDFGGESAVPLIEAFNNLLVVQTVSKSRALAGLRVGYALGHEDLIDALNRVKNSFNSYPIDRLSEIATIASFEDEDYFQEHRQSVIATREYTAKALTKLSFKVLPSQANFVFAQPITMSAQEVYQALRVKKILVRYFDKPRIDQFLRISIGSQAEMEAFIQAIAEIVVS